MATLQRAKAGKKPERTFSRLGLRGAALLGRKIAIFWEDTEEGDQWYEGEIKEYNVKTHEHLIFYDDGDRDWYVLDEVRYRLTDEEEEKLEDVIAQAEIAEVSRAVKRSPLAEKHLAEARQATQASADTWDDLIKNEKESLRIEVERRKRQYLSALNSGKATDLEIETLKAKQNSAEENLRWLKWAGRSILEERRRLAEIHARDNSIGGVRALRLVFEDMLRERYRLSEAERRNEYEQILDRGRWKRPVVARSDLTAEEMQSPEEAAAKTRRRRDRANRDGKAGIKAALLEMRSQRNMGNFMNSLKAGMQSSDDLARRFKELRKLQADIDLADQEAELKEEHDKNARTRTEKANRADLGSESTDHGQLAQDAIDLEFDLDAKVPEFNVDSLEKEILGLVKEIDNDCVPRAANAKALAANEQPAEEPASEGSQREGKVGTEEELVMPYLAEFEDAVGPEEVLIGAVSVEDLEQTEREMEARRIAAERTRMDAFVARESDLAWRARAASRLVNDRAAEREATLREMEEKMIERQSVREKEMRVKFQQKEDALRAHLKYIEGEVTEKYGTLEVAKDTGRLAYRRVGIDWAYYPQPVQIYVDRLAAVRDRLGQGKYCVLVTLYDHIGGKPLHWSQLPLAGNEGSLDQPGSTKPVRHSGHFTARELVINQNIFCVCPSRVGGRPSNVFVFEIFRIGNKENEEADTVEAWGILPSRNATSSIVGGLFRIPLLRGAVDPDVDKHEEFEETYSKDVDRWVCNMYIEVRCLPREADLLDTRSTVAKFGDSARELLGGDPAARQPVSEFDVHMDFTSELLGIRGFRRKEGEEDPDSSVLKPILNAEGKVEKYEKVAFPQRKYSKSELGGVGGSQVFYRSSLNFLGEHKIMKFHTKTPAIRRHSKSMAPEAGHALAAALSKKMKRQQTDKKATENLDDSTSPLHRIAIRRLGEKDTSVDYLSGNDELTLKLRFLFYEIMSDFELRKFMTIEFWTMMAITLLAVWLRMYLHYIGEFVLLQIFRFPVYEFTPLPYTCVLKYVSQTMPVRYELGLIAIGPLFNGFCFAIFFATSLMYQRSTGAFPEIMSRFGLGFGLGLVFDIPLVLVVDLVTHNYNCDAICGDVTSPDCMCYEGDSFKLYSRFLRDEGSGVSGLVLTLFISVSVTALHAFLFYVYLLNCHNNGRVIDLYRRLMAYEGDFFVPHDYELSVNELRWICKKANAYRAEDGASRRVTVCDYTLTDPLDPGFSETTTHIAIYDMTMRGAKRLYRHFLRLPTGAVIELFGEFKLKLGREFDGLRGIIATADGDG